MNTRITIRLASPGEIDEAIAIDDDACQLFARAGLNVDVDPVFSQAERERWIRSMRQSNAFFAACPDGRCVGLLVLGRVDGEPYLDQLSVRVAAMRQGIGRLLLRRAHEWAGARPLWLTTYSHIPWNRPFYEREGFVVIAESRCSRGILELLAEQRRSLPAPEERIAMRGPHSSR